ncbi:MAG TPA: DUF3106 domain-containing protein [Verrucomicrobiae bacterium]|jgi:hypothetical protein|nr:DUF3106 domain-containing protein [Verrucomicrobiae bacterium]
MNRPHQARWLAAAIFAAAQLVVFSIAGQTATNVPALEKISTAVANLVPPVPQAHSPVDFFRNLLAMSPRDRNNFLTNKSPEVRTRILDKVKEYLALDPNERELRLRATELRWYLTPLLRESPTNRDARIAQLPDDLRDLIRSRLEQWDALPPELRREFLDNERALRYFTHVDATNSLQLSERDPHHGPNDDEQARWNTLSENERGKITAQFNQFFELTPGEKQKTLGTLSGAERAQMEKTLQSFDKLPPPQRRECIHAFTEFAGMSPKDRAEFLKNAGQWSQMPPKDRQAWRDLVANVPQWPPLPMPPMPPVPMPVVQRNFHPPVATNLN